MCHFVMGFDIDGPFNSVFLDLLKIPVTTRMAEIVPPHDNGNFLTMFSLYHVTEHGNDFAARYWRIKYHWRK